MQQLTHGTPYQRDSGTQRHAAARSGRQRHAAADTTVRPGSVRLLYRAISKTGITSTMNLLGGGIGAHVRVAAMGKWAVHRAFDPAVPKRAGDFLIGAIRNPCDYYVSLWAYSVDHSEAGLRKQLALEAGAPAFFDASAGKAQRRDIDLFRQFTRFIQGDIGVYSARLAYGYVPSAFGLGRNFTTRWLPRKACEDAGAKLGRLNTSQVDCWVSTESLAADVRACLGVLSGRHGYDVDWEAYRKAEAALRTNPSTHARCQDYFDEDLERFIREKDGLVFRKFGFDRCCGAGSSLAAHLSGRAAA